MQRLVVPLLMRFAPNDLYRLRKAAPISGTVWIIDEPRCCQQQKRTNDHAEKIVRTPIPNPALGFLWFLIFIFVVIHR